MKLRKIFACGMAIISLFCTTAFAAGPSAEMSAEAKQMERVSAAQSIAYLDIDEASPAMQARILEARDVIINNTSWVADGYTAVVHKANGTSYEVPKFSELFPGWDMPMESIAFTSANSGLVPMASEGSATHTNIALKNPSATADSDPFYYFTMSETLITWVDDLIISETCNLGYTNMQTHQSVAKLTYMEPGDSIEVNTVPGHASDNVAVRASTFSTPGLGNFHSQWW